MASLEASLPFDSLSSHDLSNSVSFRFKIIQLYVEELRKCLENGITDIDKIREFICYNFMSNKSKFKYLEKVMQQRFSIFFGIKETFDAICGIEAEKIAKNEHDKQQLMYEIEQVHKIFQEVMINFKTLLINKLNISAEIIDEQFKLANKKHDDNIAREKFMDWMNYNNVMSSKHDEASEKLVKELQAENEASEKLVKELQAENEASEKLVKELQAENEAEKLQAEKLQAENEASEKLVKELQAEIEAEIKAELNDEKLAKELQTVWDNENVSENDEEDSENDEEDSGRFTEEMEILLNESNNNDEDDVINIVTEVDDESGLINSLKNWWYSENNN